MREGELVRCRFSACRVIAQVIAITVSICAELSVAVEGTRYQVVQA